MKQNFSGPDRCLRNAPMPQALAGRLRSLFFLLFFLLIPVTVLAAAANYDEDTVRLVIDGTKSLLKSKATELQKLVEASERLDATLLTVRECVESNTEELDKVNKSLEAFGPKGPKLSRHQAGEATGLDAVQCLRHAN